MQNDKLKSKIMKNYLQYYFLEKYLFNEINKNFKNHKCLTSIEFFCIVIWKANRAKTSIKRKLLTFGNNLDVIINKLTYEIYQSRNNEEKLKILLKNYRFNLPMATAILTVLYPKEFTIYDARVRNQIGMNSFSGIKKYFSEFLPKVKQMGKGKNLRDKDRYLWGKSFYEDLLKFLNF